MSSGRLADLLQRWREAEMRWERTPHDADANGEVRRAVIDAWRAYNEAAGSLGEDEMVLVADDSMAYVAVFGPTERVLGWPCDALVGRSISEVTPPESMALMEAHWSEFMTRGRLEGTYPLLTRDGGRVMTRFHARAHHPLPGFHTSRLWTVDEAAS